LTLTAGCHSPTYNSLKSVGLTAQESRADAEKPHDAVVYFDVGLSSLSTSNNVD